LRQFRRRKAGRGQPRSRPGRALSTNPGRAAPARGKGTAKRVEPVVDGLLTGRARPRYPSRRNARASTWRRRKPHGSHGHQHAHHPTVEHLSGDRDLKPVWLWSSQTGATAADIYRWRQAFLRRFDLEHTFRLFKQTLDWARPHTPAAGDTWTWLIIAAHTRLRLVRPLVADLRRPWGCPAEPDRLTPARVRRGFRNIRPTTLQPARAPKPSRPGPQGLGVVDRSVM
jgi:hypothetical protein